MKHHNRTQGFGEPITGTGLLILAGLGGAIAWIALRSKGSKPAWFADVTKDGVTYLGAVARTKEEAQSQVTEAIFQINRFASESKRTAPVIGTIRVYEERPTTDAWALWLRWGGAIRMNAIYVPAAFFETKEFAEKALSNIKSVPAKDRGVFSGVTNFMITKVKIPDFYGKQLLAGGLSGLAGSESAITGGIPAAFYKFTNPEEIIS